MLPAWGNAAGLQGQALLWSAHLVLGPPGPGVSPPGVQACPPSLPPMQHPAARGHLSHLSPVLFEPSAAAIKSPPLPSPTLKELDLKLI